MIEDVIEKLLKESTRDMKLIVVIQLKMLEEIRLSKYKSIPLIPLPFDYYADGMPLPEKVIKYEYIDKNEYGYEIRAVCKPWDMAQRSNKDIYDLILFYRKIGFSALDNKDVEKINKIKEIDKP